jgi:hypothetical protein
VGGDGRIEAGIIAADCRVRLPGKSAGQFRKNNTCEAIYSSAAFVLRHLFAFLAILMGEG